MMNKHTALAALAASVALAALAASAASVVLAAAIGRVAARFCGMWFQPPAALPPVVPAIKSTFYIINPTPATLLYMR